MNNKEINELYDVITSLKAKKLPIKMSFILSRDIKIMQDIVDDIENSRSNIIKNYGEKDENGELIISDDGQVKIPADFAEQYKNDMDELYMYETNTELERIPVSEIEKCDLDKYDSLTLEEVYEINKIIEEEEE